MSISSAFSRVAAQIASRLSVPAASFTNEAIQRGTLPLDLERRLTVNFMAAFNDRESLIKAKEHSVTARAAFHESPRDQSLWEASRDADVAFSEAAQLFDVSRRLALTLHERLTVAGYLPGQQFAQLHDQLCAEEPIDRSQMATEASPLALYGDLSASALMQRNQQSQSTSMRAH